MKTKYRLANIHKIVDLLLSTYLQKGSICIDATLGNGFDSLKIYKALHADCKIYAFDIQNIAINKSKELFQSNNISLDKINFINDSHEHVDKYVQEEVDFFIMNLGYLPQGDKSITTTYQSVLVFLEKVFHLMKKGSFGLIVFYPGHPSGQEEYFKTIEYLSNLNQKEINVIKIEQMNQMNKPPKLVMVERL